MLAPFRTAAPAVLPVSLAEAKVHCRVDHDDDNAMISTLIDAAVAHLDGYAGVLGRALVTQSWRQDFCGFSDRMRLPVGPCASIASVTYFDADNVSQTLADTVYQVLADARGPYLTLKPGQDWPPAYDRADAVSVTWVAGSAADAVPAALKVAIFFRVKAAYDPPSNEGGMLIRTAEALEAPYSRVGV